jgi:hypothetical protein
MDDNVPADADADQVRFDNLNATYSATFGTFSAAPVYPPIGSNVMEINMRVPRP